MPLAQFTVGETPQTIATADATAFTVSNHGPGDVYVIGGSATAPTTIASAILVPARSVLAQSDMTIFRGGVTRLWLRSVNATPATVLAGQT